MIEINLLPAAARKTEGMPAPRLAAVALSALITLAIAAYTGNYYFRLIPKVQADIDTVKAYCANKENLDKDQEVSKTEDNISKLNAKIVALGNLNASRVRYARLFDRLTNAVVAPPMPDGVWFEGFSLTPETSRPRYPDQGAGQWGKRYTITLFGWARGDNYPDRTHKVTELLRSLERSFRIPPEDAPLPNPVPADYAFDKTLGLRFERPIPLGFQDAPLPALANVDPRTLKQINPPASALSFRLTVTYELPAAKPGG